MSKDKEDNIQEKGDKEQEIEDKEDQERNEKGKLFYKLFIRKD
jgi:hypothetical protein